MELKRYKIEITLISDSLIGSSDVAGAIIDKDCVFDEVGLPLIPGKRLKGLFKECFTLLREFKYKDILSGDIFGNVGSTNRDNWTLHIPTLTVKDYLINKHYLSNQIVKGKISKEQVVKYFTSLRSMTKIDPNGIASDTSLRTIRVLNKGIVFEGELEIDSKFEAVLCDISLLMRRIGSMRNRGLGHVKCRLIERYDFKENYSEVKKAVKSDLNYSITTLEPLIITNQTNNSHYTETLQYIRGTIIQGLFAQEFLKSTRNNNTYNDFLRLIIKGGAIFSNGFPHFNNHAFTPAPFSIIQEKGSEKCTHNLLVKDTQEPSRGISSLTYIENDKLFALKIPQKIRLHTQINSETKISEKGLLFNYQSLPSGIIFKGNIFTENPEDQLKIRNSIKSGSIFRIGKSSTAEYGKVRFEWIDETISSDINVSNHNPVVLSFLSDTIVYNDCGFSSLDIKYLYKYLKGAAVKKIFTKKTQVDGFLNIWKLRKPTDYAFSAGTIMLLDRLPENYQELNDYGIGERTNEGYGQVKIIEYNSLTEKLDYCEFEIDSFSLCSNIQIPYNSDISPLLSNTIIKSILSEKIQSIFKSKALKDASETFDLPTNSLLAKIRGFSENPLTLNDNLRALKDKAKKQLSKSYLNSGNSMLDHLNNIKTYLGRILEKFNEEETADINITNELIRNYLNLYLVQLRRLNNNKN